LTDLTWTKCPRCGEISDLLRVGPALRLRTKRLKGAAPTWTAQVYTQSINTMVRCNFCGNIFHTTEPTRREAMGFDGIGDTPY